jgi:hypothetical protein
MKTRKAKLFWAGRLGRTAGAWSLGLIAVGCGSSADSGSNAVTGWLGESPHLAITGTLATVGSSPNQTFDVHLEGDKAANIYCHRFYTPIEGAMPDGEGNYDTSQLYFAMKELGGVVDVGGVQKEFTISYWRHDVAAGTDLQVVPRVFRTPIPEGKTWSDVNIFDPGTDLLAGIETAAASGTVSMKLNTGTPDDNGVVIPSGGRTGEFISVSWGPHDNLSVSATADCITLMAPWATPLIPK